MASEEISARFGSDPDGAGGSLESPVIGNTEMPGEGEGERANGFLAAPDPVVGLPEPLHADEAGAAGSALEAPAGGPASAKAPKPDKEARKRGPRKSMTAARKDANVQALCKAFDKVKEAIQNNTEKKYGTLTEMDVDNAAQVLSQAMCIVPLSAPASRLITSTMTKMVKDHPQAIGTVPANVGPKEIMGVLLEKTTTKNATDKDADDGEDEERGGAASGSKKKREKREGASSGRSTSRRTAGSTSVQTNKPPFTAASEPKDVKEWTYLRLPRTILTTTYDALKKGDSASEVLAKLTTATTNLQTDLGKEYKETTGAEYTEKAKTLEELAERLISATLFFSTIALKAKEIFDGKVEAGRKNFSHLNMSPHGGLTIDNMCEMVQMLRDLAAKNKDWIPIQSLIEVVALHTTQGAIAARLFTMPRHFARMQNPRLNTRFCFNGDPIRGTELLRQLVKAYKLDVTEEKIKQHGQLWTDTANLMDSCRLVLQGKDLDDTAMTADDFQQKYSNGTAVPAAAVDIPPEAVESSMQAGAQVPVAALQDAEGAAEGAAEAGAEDAAQGAVKGRAPRKAKKKGILATRGEVREGTRRSVRLEMQDLAKSVMLDCTAAQLAAEQDLGDESAWTADAEMQDSNDGGAASASGPTSD